MPPNDPERAVIVERLAASIYKQGEQKNKAGDSAAAVEDFLRVSKMAPTSKVRANADFDAAALLITAEAVGPRHRRARGLPAQLSAKSAAGGRHAQARGGLFGVEPTRSGRRRVRANRAVSDRDAGRAARGDPAGGRSVRQGRQYREVAQHARGVREAFPAALESGHGSAQQIERDRGEVGRSQHAAIIGSGRSSRPTGRRARRAPIAVGCSPPRRPSRWRPRRARSSCASNWWRR